MSYAIDLLTRFERIDNEDFRTLKNRFVHVNKYLKSYTHNPWKNRYNFFVCQNNLKNAYVWKYIKNVSQKVLKIDNLIKKFDVKIYH